MLNYVDDSLSLQSFTEQINPYVTNLGVVCLNKHITIASLLQEYFKEGTEDVLFSIISHTVDLTLYRFRKELGKKKFNLNYEIERLAANISSQCLFSVPITQKIPYQIFSNFLKYQSQFEKRSLLKFIGLSHSPHRFKRCADKFAASLQLLMSERVVNFKERGFDSERDMLSILMQKHVTSPSSLDEIIPIMQVIYLTFHMLISQSLTTIFQSLADKKLIQQSIYNECCYFANSQNINLYTLDKLQEADTLILTIGYQKKCGSLFPLIQQLIKRFLLSFLPHFHIANKKGKFFLMKRSVLTFETI